MREALLDRALDAEVETGVANGRVLAYLAQHAQIQNRTYDDDRVLLQCRIPRRCLNFLQENGVQRPAERAADVCVEVAQWRVSEWRAGE